MATLRTNTKEFMNRFAVYFMQTMETKIEDYNDFVGRKEYNEESLTDCLMAFWKSFDEEFNNAYNKKRWPRLQARVGQWLRGLPIGIDYADEDIINVAKRLGSVGENSTKRTLDAVVNNWFEFFAGKVIELSEKNNINMPR